MLKIYTTRRPLAISDNDTRDDRQHKSCSKQQIKCLLGEKSLSTQEDHLLNTHCQVQQPKPL